MKMRRTNHYIKHNVGTELPSDIITLDTEAFIKHEDKRQNQTFRLGCAIHITRRKNDWITGKPIEFHTVQALHKWILGKMRSKTKLFLFAHNMSYDYAISKFDTFLSDNKLELKLRIFPSPFIFQTKYDTSLGSAIFLSTTNFYRQSLEELGSIFGIPKLEKPDFENCTDSELMTYCIGDTLVLAHVITTHMMFIKEKDLGCFKPTIAGQAFTAYRHRFMPPNLLVHTHSDILELEKKSYRGGRNEAFRIGTFDNITGLDVNSMYPFVMRKYEYPTALVNSTTLKKATVDTLHDVHDSRNRFTLANCDIELFEPAIAYRAEKLLFPIGNIRQVITYPEIEYLLNHPETGIIHKVHSLVLYEKEDIFSKYVKEFYDFRMSTENNAYRELAKLILNSLYGKFGQSRKSESEIVTDESLRDMLFSMMKEDSTGEVFTGFGSKYVKHGTDIYHIQNIEGEYARDSIPIIASAVTGYARMMLFKLIKQAGFDNVVYCDTDSLFVNDTGLHNLESLISPTELGKLKVEKSGSVTIRSCKDYTFGDEIKRKGIKKNAVQIGENTFQQSMFLTGNMRYRKGIPDGVVIVEPITKTLSGIYDKGTVENDIVIPFSLSDF